LIAHSSPNGITSIGYAVTPSGHEYAFGGGGLQIAPDGHSTLTAAEQPLASLNTVHTAPGSGRGFGGGFGAVVTVPGGGGFAIGPGGRGGICSVGGGFGGGCCGGVDASV
jgi:hypothetical protein